MTRLHVGIAGAGIAGLAAAAFLARAGHRVTLLERFAAPRPVGSGLVLQPVGQAVLADLGLLDAARARGHPIRRLEGRDSATGRAVLDVRYDAGGAGRTGLGMHRAALFDILFAAAVAAGAEIVADRTVTGADPSTGRFATTGGAAPGPFDLALDTLGAASPLVPEGRPLPFGALWATLDWPGDASAPEALTQVYRRARWMAGILPLGRPDPAGPHRVAVFWSLPVAAHAAWAEAPLSDWKAEAAALWPDFARLVATVPDHAAFAMARYRHRTLPDPVAGRLVHLGDAWHAASPQLGQGANMALLDAAALARAVERHGAAGAPAAFRRARQRHVLAYQAISRVFTPLYQSESRTPPVLRDRVLAPLAQLPGISFLLGRLVSGDLLPPERG